MRRKSIARRRPVVVYRVEMDDETPGTVIAKGWIAEDDVTRRLDRTRPCGRAWTDEQVETIRGQWIDNTDTDAIHALPAAVRDLIWEFDDKIREALK